MHRERSPACLTSADAPVATTASRRARLPAGHLCSAFRLSASSNAFPSSSPSQGQSLPLPLRERLSNPCPAHGYAWSCVSVPVVSVQSMSMAPRFCRHAVCWSKLLPAPRM